MSKSERTPILPRPASPRRFVVLDIETRMDEFARKIASDGRPAGKTHIREVVCASMVRLEFDEAFNVISSKLESFHQDEFDEPTILSNVDDWLETNTAAGGELVTYNGLFHDLPILRGRLVRWWHFGAAGIRHHFNHGHLDLAEWLRAGGRGFPSLRDACAGIGISIKPPTFLGRQSNLAPYEVLKCELDVLGTAILLFHYLAEIEGSDKPLARGLIGLGKEVRLLARGKQHLETLALNPVFARAPAPWGRRTS